MGLAITQAVRRRLPTAATRVRAQVRSCGICGGPSGSGAGYLRVLRSPLLILIPSIAPQSPSSVIWGWYNRSVSGRRTKWTQSPHPKKLKNKKATSRMPSGGSLLCVKFMPFIRMTHKEIFLQGFLSTVWG
jgi:hypothetical protein